LTDSQVDGIHESIVTRVLDTLAADRR